MPPPAEPRIHPQSCRAARALLGWSLRGLASYAAVSLPTLLKIEAGKSVSGRSAAKVRAAFLAKGVALNGADAERVPPEIRQVPLTAGALNLGAFVTLHGPRRDGTYRVLFEAPRRVRPAGWMSTIPLPITSPRTGRLSDANELARIRADAAELRRRLQEGREQPARRAGATPGQAVRARGRCAASSKKRL